MTQEARTPNACPYCDSTNTQNHADTKGKSGVIYTNLVECRACGFLFVSTNQEDLT